MRGPFGRLTHYRRIAVNGGAFRDFFMKAVKFTSVNLAKLEIFALMGCYATLIGN